MVSSLWVLGLVQSCVTDFCATCAGPECGAQGVALWPQDASHYAFPLSDDASQGCTKRICRVLHDAVNAGDLAIQNLQVSPIQRWYLVCRLFVHCCRIGPAPMHIE